MKLPKNLYVFGEKYSLKRVKGLAAKGICGEVNRDTKEIIIDSNLKGSELHETIIHEVGHCVFHEVSLYQSISHDLEEVIVDTIAKALAKNFDLRAKK